MSPAVNGVFYRSASEQQVVMKIRLHATCHTSSASRYEFAIYDMVAAIMRKDEGHYGAHISYEQALVGDAYIAIFMLLLH